MGGVILHHAALPHRGGAVRVARLLLAAQRQAGHDARLSYEVAENDPEDLGAPLPDDPTPPDALGRRWAGLPPQTRLHLHTSTDWPALLTGLAATGSDRPAPLLTLHDAAPLTGGCAYPLDCPHFPACAEPCPRGFAAAKTRQAETLALLERLAPVLVSPSRWLAGLAKRALPTLPVRVLPNGVPWPTAEALPGRARARALLGLPEGAPVALFAAHGGHRAAYKSGPAWGDYWAEVRAALPGALAFAAGGDAAGSADGLTVWPYVDRARLALLMRAADLLLYPTLADNHPLVLLEAAALELAALSFAVGGVPEILIPGETGELVPPEAGSAGFCRAAAALLAEPARCRRLGRAARDRGGRRFDAARMAEDYARLLA